MHLLKKYIDDSDVKNIQRKYYFPLRPIQNFFLTKSNYENRKYYKNILPSKAGFRNCTILVYNLKQQ